MLRFCTGGSIIIFLIIIGIFYKIKNKDSNHKKKNNDKHTLQNEWGQFIAIDE